MNDLESEIVIQDDYDKKMTTGIISCNIDNQNNLGKYYQINNVTEN